ncbi:MAG: DNA repair protein RecN [Bacteroidales bacterium]
MIKSLYIRNYALIDSLEINFESGFTSITGETGAGKSIILGALSLILGQRAESKYIKNNESKTVIEGCFDLSAYDVELFFQENQIEYDPKSSILRRELHPSGKSRAFINDTPVTLVQLRTLASTLIDIHSQHQNLLLSDPMYQLRVVDTLAGSGDTLKSYKEEYKSYRQMVRELKQLTERVAKSRQEEDYLRFQFNQLEEAALKEGEQVEVENELQMLTHAEELKSALYKISQILSTEEYGILSPLKEAINNSTSIERIYPKAKELSERLQSNLIDLKDISAEAETQAEDMEFDPSRQLHLQERLNLIYTLEQKHQVKSIEELIAIHSELDQRIAAIDNSDSQLEDLQKRVEQKRDSLMSIGAQLSLLRNQAGESIANSLVERVSLLGMPNTQIKLHFVSKEEPDENGLESVEFLFTANSNSPLLPIAEVASGGEISRVMLSIKAIIASVTALPTIIFDEIDTGVSGEISDKMGDIMVEMSNHMQVMSITHLPQVAAKGSTQLKVYKIDDGETTVTNLVQLTTQERVEEIARMLSGATITESALSHAREMLSKNN